MMSGSEIETIRSSSRGQVHRKVLYMKNDIQTNLLAVYVI